jgi:hypothetical protein
LCQRQNPPEFSRFAGRRLKESENRLPGIHPKSRAGVAGTATCDDRGTAHPKDPNEEYGGRAR